MTDDTPIGFILFVFAFVIIGAVRIMWRDRRALFGFVSIDTSEDVNDYTPLPIDRWGVFDKLKATFLVWRLGADAVYYMSSSADRSDDTTDTDAQTVPVPADEVPVSPAVPPNQDDITKRDTMIAALLDQGWSGNKIFTHLGGNRADVLAACKRIKQERAQPRDLGPAPTWQYLSEEEINAAA